MSFYMLLVIRRSGVTVQIVQISENMFLGASDSLPFLHCCRTKRPSRDSSHTKVYGPAIAANHTMMNELIAVPRTRVHIRDEMSSVGFCSALVMSRSP